MEKPKNSNMFKANSKRIKVYFINLHMDWILDYWEWRKHAAISKLKKKKNIALLKLGMKKKLMNYILHLC